MDLKEYFEKKNGFGVPSTADENGKVDAAPYARPHEVDDTHIAFIMSDRLSHANIRKIIILIKFFFSSVISSSVLVGNHYKEIQIILLNGI